VLQGVAVLAVGLGNVALVAGSASAVEYSSTPRATTWSAMNGRVYAIEQVGNTVFIGGSFTTLRAPTGGQTVTRNRLAAFDATTGALLPWNPGANGDVRALHASSTGTGLFVGGLFSSIAGTTRNRMAEVSTSTGQLMGGFTANVNGAVYALERIGTTIYMGGGFSTLGGQSRPRLAAVNEATGAPVAGWSGSADTQVKSLAASPDGSRLFVGGEFRQLDGQSRDFIGALNAGNGTLNAWRPPSPCSDLQNPCYVLDLAQDGSRVYGAVGGPGGRALAWDINTGARRWAAYGDGDAQAIAVLDGIVYVGGHFGPNFGNQPREGFAALNATSGGVLPFAPTFAGGLKIWDIQATNSVLRVGGGFNRVGTSSQRQRYAEFGSTAAVVDTQPPTAPTGLRAPEVSDTSTTLYWNQSTDDTGVTGYRLLRNGSEVATPNVTTYTDRGLQPSTQYTYQVQAVDGFGHWSDLSDPLTITTDAAYDGLVHQGTTWRYWSTGSNQGTQWVQPGYSDTNWSTGDAQLGYGDSDEATVISPLGVTHYFRKTFSVTNSGAISSLTLRLLADDGAVVYINGTEVRRQNLPSGAITYQTLASSDVNGQAEQTWQEAPLASSLVHDGTNTIAVEVHNSSTTDPDLSFDLELLAN
jgi:hypothetical protein